jgi:DNA (cytosine-5)-methyltransferase 1
MLHAKRDGEAPMRALDLFCGQGGATRGLQLAGYHVTGVDIEPQPHYIGDAFEQGDAFDWLSRDLSEYDLIHASPKCQGHSVLTPTKYKGDHEIQLPRVLDLLRAQTVPFIVENVEGTQVYMRNPIMLCGSMFGLPIQRHRWFELGNIDAFFLLPPCNHSAPPVLVSGTTRRLINGKRHEFSKADCAAAIGIDWMTRIGLDQAIPPAYSKFLALALQEAHR